MRGGSEGGDRSEERGRGDWESIPSAQLYSATDRYVHCQTLQGSPNDVIGEGVL